MRGGAFRGHAIGCQFDISLGGFEFYCRALRSNQKPAAFSTRCDTPQTVMARQERRAANEDQGDLLSMLLLAVQMASSQLSPRIIASTFKDVVIRRCVAFFAFAFIFSAATQARIIEDQVPELADPSA